jgi:hypothetical protein
VALGPEDLQRRRKDLVAGVGNVPGLRHCVRLYNSVMV